MTVAYDREGPTRAIGLVRFADGTRTWATSTDPGLIRTCTEVESVGKPIEVASGTFSL